MKKLLSATIWVCIAMVCSLVSCSDNEKPTAKEQIDNLYNFREYVSNATQGEVSNRSDIKVVLQQPVEGWDANKELNENWLEISPKVPGKVVALNNQTIAFVPQQPLESNTNYTLKLSLGAIYKDIPKDYSSFTFHIHTIQQDFSLLTNNLESYSKEWQYVAGTLRTADVMELSDAKKLVSATQQGKPLNIKFDEGTTAATLFSFTIDSIQRQVENDSIAISWSGKPLGIDNEGTEYLVVPGKNNFVVTDVYIQSTGDQYVGIYFSDPIMKSQNLEGLVSISGVSELTYTIKGNILRVYPKETLKGSALVEVFQGIKSVDGYKLKETFSQNVAFEQLKPEVKLLSNATILPNSDNLKVNFQAVNLKKVDVSVTKIYQNNILQFLQFNDLQGSSYLRNVARPIARKTITLQNNLNPSNASHYRAYAIDLKDLITPDPGAIYRVSINFRPSYSMYHCDSTNFDTLETEEEDFDDTEENSSWDGIEDYYYYEDDYYYGYSYNWRERDNPCHTSYYRNKGVAVNVLASNIGLTVKRGENKTYFVSVNNLISTAPEQGAKVTFYNLQQQVLGSVTTDADGFAYYDSKHPAYFAIAEKGSQKTYIKLNDGNALSVSKFDVAGNTLQKGLKGYIYGERGVWRPGDTLFLSFMLNDAKKRLPKEHPVKFELFDPFGKLVEREVQGNAPSHFYKFITQTDANAPTGNWSVKVSVGGATFSKRIKIETVKPNRLKIKAAFDEEILSGAKPILGHLEVLWLHGAIAKNLKADMNAKFYATTTEFKTFPGYIFDDPSRNFGMEEQKVFDGKVDGSGKANFSLKPELEKKAPGMLKASFITKVYENGGDFSTDVFSKTYAPYSTFVGLNVPKGDKTRGMLLTDTPHKFEVVTVDEYGKPKAVEDLKVTIHKVSWRWWWDTSSDNISSYNGSNIHEEVFSQHLSTGANGKASFNFELKYPNWGRYLVRVEDTKGGHATGKTMYIDWPGWAGKSRKNDPSAATVLAFSTDKKAYQVGEKAVVTFPSSAQGRALVTIENGSEVLDALWVTPSKGETKFELPITAAFAPNVYIHISLLQPHANAANDLPIRMYGVMPISVENPSTKLHPQIAMPKVLRPEETVTVKVNEQSGKAMTYSLAIVDEGLLDLTRFKTPNPWDEFYAREALGVKTWDVYDDVIGAYGGRIDQVFAIGGDGSLAGAKNKKANRFKPMVIYKGPFTLKAGETKSHQLKIPKYIGSVRTMVVAENEATQAYGEAENTTPVRKPLMVLASLPRKITSGEKVTLPVTVFAMEDKVKDVKIKIQPDAAFMVTSSNTQSLHFDQPDEQMAYFELEVFDFQGVGKVIVEASGNGEKASYEVEIDVVNPNPVTTEATDYTLQPNEKTTLNLETFGVMGSNEAQLELSTLPPMNFTGRLQYLIRYPHGCVEQTTSGAFPQLYLSDLFSLPEDKKIRAQQHIELAIKRLGSFQLPGGGLSYWPGQGSANDWGTSYAGHFMLEAEKKGYVLPISFKSNWIRYQKQAAKQWRQQANRNDLAQAYRLYTLALAGSAEVSAMNRMRETTGISNEAKFRLAAAYALIGQTKAAKELLKNTNIDYKPSTYDYYTYGSVDRNRAMAVETYLLLKDKTAAQQQAMFVAKNLNSQQYMSTQTTAYSLLAMAKFAEMVGSEDFSVELHLNGKTETLSSGSKTLLNKTLNIKDGSNAIKLNNQKDQTVFVKVIASGILPVGQEKPLQKNLSAVVSFKDGEGKSISVDNLQQGTNFVAEVTLTNTSGENIKDVALTEIFPSGWEIINTRFTDFGKFGNNEVTYTDLRDDRANFYFDLKGHESKTIRILLNASYLGTFYLPGIQCEAMYDNNYVVRTKGKWVKVMQ